MMTEVKFSRGDLESLRGQLLQLRSDYDALTEVIQAFSNSLGYGISREGARQAAVEFATAGRSVDAIRSALDRFALAA